MQVTFNSVFKNCKGILILTHKEFSKLINYLCDIKKNYFIIVHNGSVNIPIINNFIDLNMVTHEQYKKYNNNNNLITYTSRNFLNFIFNNRENINYKK